MALESASVMAVTIAAHCVHAIAAAVESASETAKRALVVSAPATTVVAGIDLIVIDKARLC